MKPSRRRDRSWHRPTAAHLPPIALLALIALVACSEVIDAPNATFKSPDAHVGRSPDTARQDITAASSRFGDNFGTALALQDEELLVVAPTAELSGVRSAAEESCGETVDITDAGRIYAFEHHTSGWMESEQLQRDGAENGDGIVSSAGFSTLPRISIARQENTVAVGVPGSDGSGCRDAASAGVAPLAATQAGAVYVFERSDDGHWNATDVLRASDSRAADFFGSNLALRGDELFVGSPGTDTSAPKGAGRTELADSGAVYVFARAGERWHEQQRVEPDNPIGGAFFGSAVSVDGDTLAVGAWLDFHGERGINPPPSAEQAGRSGAAYVFREREGRWEQEAYFKAFNRDPEDLFGMSIALEKDTLLVGAPEEASGAATANASDLELESSDRNDVRGAGAVYVYQRSGNSWSFDTYLKSPESQAYSAFGVAVSIHAGRILVGAPDQHGRSDEGDDLPDVGAAYLYQRVNDMLVLKTRFGPADVHRGVRFGFSTALTDHFAAIGAPEDMVGPGWVSVYDLDASSSPTE